MRKLFIYLFREVIIHNMALPKGFSLDTQSDLTEEDCSIHIHVDINNNSRKSPYDVKPVASLTQNNVVDYSQPILWPVLCRCSGIFPGVFTMF